MTITFKRIDSLQFLRAFAAISVMIFHGTKMLEAQLKFKFLDKLFVSGYSGVDVFFVISGFIILHTSNTQDFNVFRFFKKRFIRIFPVYWLVTIALLIAYCISPSSDQSYKGNINVIIGSLTLFPQKQYVVGIAWTLTFEVMFYIVFAIAYSAGKKCLYITLITWSAIILLLYALGIKASNTFADMFLNPIILEFGFGCLLAYLYEHYKHVKASSLIAATGILLFITSWFVFYNAKYTNDDAFGSNLSRVYLFGVPAAISIYGLLYYANKVSPIFIYLGNASYSLYLIHGTVISVILKVLYKLRIDNYFSNTLGGLSIFVLTIIISCLFYSFVEKPILSILSGYKAKRNKHSIFPIREMRESAIAGKA